MSGGSLKSFSFACRNELTRCLGVGEKVRSHPLLLREVVANMRRHGAHRDVCVSELVRAFRTRRFSSELGYSPIRMLLMVYMAFPECASTEVVRVCAQRKIEDRRTFLCLLWVVKEVLRRGEEVDLSMAVDQGFEGVFGPDTEMSYLFLEVLFQVAQRTGLMKEQVELLEQKLPGSLPLVLVPKLIQLAAVVPLKYRAPRESVSLGNTSARLATLNALAFFGCVSSKERLLEVCPGEEREFAGVFKEFLCKRPVQPDFEEQPATKEELFSVSSITNIKKLFFSGISEDEIIRKIKKILQINSV